MKTVFVVKRNSDFTEGRGPMILDSIFETYELALSYIRQEGLPYGGDYSPKKYTDNTWSFGGWYDITEVPVFDKVKSKKDKLIEAALKKLTMEEKEALGIK